jgi:hypothetical protein
LVDAVAQEIRDLPVRHNWRDRRREEKESSALASIQVREVEM